MQSLHYALPLLCLPTTIQGEARQFNEKIQAWETDGDYCHLNPNHQYQGHFKNEMIRWDIGVAQAPAWRMTPPPKRGLRHTSTVI